jgi:hypothetical protein
VRRVTGDRSGHVDPQGRQRHGGAGGDRPGHPADPGECVVAVFRSDGVVDELGADRLSGHAPKLRTIAKEPMKEGRARLKNA